MFTFRGMYFYWVNLGLKEGISIDADSGPLRYVLWSSGSICHQPFTFIQIGSGYTVSHDIWFFFRFLNSQTCFINIFDLFSNLGLPGWPTWYGSENGSQHRNRCKVHELQNPITCRFSDCLQYNSRILFLEKYHRRYAKNIC